MPFIMARREIFIPLISLSPSFRTDYGRTPAPPPICLYADIEYRRVAKPACLTGQGRMLKTGHRGHFLVLIAILSLSAGCDGKPGASYSHSGGAVDGWPVWGQNQLGQRFSANSQITPQNVRHLKVAWIYRT